MGRAPQDSSRKPFVLEVREGFDPVAPSNSKQHEVESSHL